METKYEDELRDSISQTIADEYQIPNRYLPDNDNNTYLDIYYGRNGRVTQPRDLLSEYLILRQENSNLRKMIYKINNEKMLNYSHNN